MTKSTGQKRKRSVQVLSMGEDQCVWMKAGVVSFKLCDSAFDCINCPFDKGMSRSVRKKPEAVVSWREAMSTKPYKEKECRHMLTGRVQYHYCSNGYRCNLCEFDQYLDESDLASAMCTFHTNSVAGFQVADSYYYHWGHSWARIEHGGFVRVGIDDFALRLLGRPTEIQLPKLGSHLEQTEPGWSIKRDDKSASVLSPMRGVVVANNHAVATRPEAAKKDPYGDGWLVVLEPQGLRENLRNLLFEKETAAWLKAEAHKLEAMVMRAYGAPLAATGGEIVDDIFGNSPDMKWEELVHEFLLT